MSTPLYFAWRAAETMAIAYAGIAHYHGNGFWHGVAIAATILLLDGAARRQGEKYHGR